MSTPRSPRDYIAHADRIVMMPEGAVPIEERWKLYEAWLSLHDVLMVEVEEGGLQELSFWFGANYSITVAFGKADVVSRAGAHALGVCFYALHNGFEAWDAV